MGTAGGGCDCETQTDSQAAAKTKTMSLGGDERACAWEREGTGENEELQN